MCYSRNRSIFTVGAAALVCTLFPLTASAQWDTTVDDALAAWNDFYGTNVVAVQWTEIGTLDDETERQQAVDDMTDPDTTWMPSGDEGTPASMTALLISDDPNIPQEDIDAWAATVDGLVEVGHRRLQIDWQKDGSIDFSTVCIVDDTTVVYDSMVSNASRSDSVAFAGRRCLDRRIGWLWQTKYADMTRGSLWADNNPLCSGGKVVSCDFDCGGSCTAGEAEVKCKSKKIGNNCCQLSYNWAWAVGFKSVKIGADGFTLEIEGIIGSSGKGNGQCTECCPATVAWAHDPASDTVGTFPVSDPQGWMPLPNPVNTTGFVNGLEFDNTNTLYCSDGLQLYTVDQVTGDGLLVGPHNLAMGGEVGDMAWDPISEQMYLVSTTCGLRDDIYVLNLEDGSTSWLCQSPLSNCSVGLAIDRNGTGYLLDLTSDFIYEIHLESCESLPHQPLPYSANFGQALTIDTATNEGYVFAFNDDRQVGEFWQWNLEGGFQLIGDLGGEPPFFQKAGADVGGTVADCITLENTGLVAGQATTWTITDAEPGQKVVVVYGFQPGDIVLNDFLGYCAEINIGGVNQSRTVGSPKNADANGEASWTKVIPVSQQGRRILTQGVGRDTCPDPCDSNVLDQDVL